MLAHSSPHTMAADQQKARYVVLGDTKDIICKKTAYHSVMGQTIDHLTCHVRQYQDPENPSRNGGNKGYSQNTKHAEMTTILLPQTKPQYNA